jgi:alkylation response protein AidB-like acyl-CoA dehydrogenase
MEDHDLPSDLSWWGAEGMRATRSGRIDFTGVEVGPERLIGTPDAYHTEPQFNGGAVRFAAVQLGGAQALFDAVRGYLARLSRTDHPHQLERLGRIAIALETGRLWLRGAADLLEEAGAATEDQVAYAQMTRSAVEAACLEVMRLSDRCVGARGLLPPSPVERIGRDLRLYLRQPAADAVLTAAGRHAAAQAKSGCTFAL